MERIAYPGEPALWEVAWREREPAGGGYFRQRPIGHARGSEDVGVSL